MEHRSILYIDPNDVYADVLRESALPVIEIVRVRTADEAERVICRRSKDFDAVVVGVFDVELVYWLRHACECPIVAAAWLPRDNETLLKVGCTHRVPRKEGTGGFLNSLFGLTP